MGKQSSKMENILITGHLGYVGASLIKFLKQTYTTCKLIGFDTQYFLSDNVLGNPEMLLDKEHIGDIREFDESILEGIDTIIHLAAISNDPISNQFENITYDINYLSSINLAKKAKLAGVKNFIFASSCSVYGFAENGEVTEESDLNPLTPYAKSKRLTEQNLEELASDNFKITCLRFSTACGISDRLRLDLVLNDFVASAYLNNKIEILSDGTPWRPLIDTIDMARAMGWAMNREGDNYLVVNVGSNEWNYQVKELARLIQIHLPQTKIIINQDASPDKRSYKVNFNKFTKLAPEYTPQININQTILDLIQGLKDFNFNDTKFRKSNLIRLNKINWLKENNLINNNLNWIK
jgi:nucleoside-diphosphate-sugar epimerase